MLIGEPMDADFYEPSKRYLHCSAVVQKKWINYGGKLQNDEGLSPSVIEEFDPIQKVWRQRQTFGDCPPGYIGSAAASIGSKFYVFGGLNEKEYFNTIHQLDFRTFEWIRLDPSNTDGVCPIPKIGAGMVSFDNRLLVTFGGKGISTFHVMENALFVRNSNRSEDDPLSSDVVWTNELLYFDVTTSKLYS